jgi:hypothetical protein
LRGSEYGHLKFQIWIGYAMVYPQSWLF